MEDTLTISVGVFGHVDSGKTSLVKALSTVSSTASFDKNPQSMERGITLDLGFSAYTEEIPEHIKGAPYKNIEIALVDAPGHASLFRTVVAGSQIIDLMILVVDVKEGFQPQTGESLVLGETVVDTVIFALNKVDMLDDSVKEKSLKRLKTKISRYMKNMEFKRFEIVETAASPKGGENIPIGIIELKNAVRRCVKLPELAENEPFVFLVDHCFTVQGRGTVTTGTVVSGKISVGDEVEIPPLGIIIKVRSLQRFRKPIEVARQGNRIGMAISGRVDTSKVERSIISTPGYVLRLNSCVCLVNPIQFFKLQLKSGGKTTVSISNVTVVATATYFLTNEAEFRPEDDHEYIPEFVPSEEATKEDDEGQQKRKMLVHFQFVKPVYVPEGCQYIASTLEVASSTACRFSYHGNLIAGTGNISLEELNIFSWKDKTAKIDRIFDDHTLIGRNLFGRKVSDNIVGMELIRTSNAEKGEIVSLFGSTGKFKVRFALEQSSTDGELLLRYMRYYFSDEKSKRMIQPK